MLNSNITVRKISDSEGLEQVFPARIMMVRPGDVRRVELNYLHGHNDKPASLAQCTHPEIWSVRINAAKSFITQAIRKAGSFHEAPVPVATAHDQS